MKEKWKNIKGFETEYQISNLGNVKSLGRERGVNKSGKYFQKEKILSLIVKNTGYIQVTLSKNKVQSAKLVHRLVAENFLSNPKNKKQINHKDGDPSNNRIDNLEWCTPSENGIHSYKVLGAIPYTRNRFGKDSPKSRMVVQKELNGHLIKIWGSGMDAVREGGFESSSITRCCRGESKTHRGYLWSYNI